MIIITLLLFVILLFFVDWLIKKNNERKKITVLYDGIRRYYHLCEYNLCRKAVITTDQTYWLYNNVKGTVMENRNVPFCIDENGFIEPTIYNENSKIKLIFMGDSTTESAIVMPENRFSVIVGMALNRKGITCSSYNGGYSGGNVYRVNQQILCKCLPIKPTHIILCSCIHDVSSLILYPDLYSTLREHGEIREDNTSIDKMFYKLKKGFRCILPNIYLELYKAKQKRKTNGNSCISDDDLQVKLICKESVKKKLDKYAREGYSTFISICKENGVTPVLMTQPNLFEKGKCSSKLNEMYSNFEFSKSLLYDDFVELFQYCSDIIRQVSCEKGVKLIDLDRTVPKNDDMIYDYVHLTDEGSKVVALEILNKLFETC